MAAGSDDRARLSYGTVSLSLLLTVRTPGSLATAGAAWCLRASQVIAPLKSRAIGRFGRRRVLTPLGIGYFAVLGLRAAALARCLLVAPQAGCRGADWCTAARTAISSSRCSRPWRWPHSSPAWITTLPALAVVLAVAGLAVAPTYVVAYLAADLSSVPTCARGHHLDRHSQQSRRRGGSRGRRLPHRPNVSRHCTVRPRHRPGARGARPGWAARAPPCADHQRRVEAVVGNVKQAR
jgi:hypothetical protein